MKAVIIASGPSLTEEDVAYCRDKKAKIYVVNTSYKLAPWADVLYACDLDWWDYHKGAPDFKGEKWTINTAAAVKYKLAHINGNIHSPFSYEKHEIATGKNSGFQALNLAVLHGATEIILLGFDMKVADKNNKHWFGNHPGVLDKNPNFKEWIKAFEKAKPYIKSKVINCTVNTDLTCFSQAKLQDIL